MSRRDRLGRKDAPARSDMPTHSTRTSHTTRATARRSRAVEAPHRRRRLVVIGAAVAVVIAVVIAGLALNQRHQDQVAAEQRRVELQVQHDAVADTVQAWVSALDGGSAADVLSHLAPPPDSPLLADEVLDAARADAVVTLDEVAPVVADDLTTARATAQVTVADQPLTWQLDLTRTDGNWTISNGLPPLTIEQAPVVIDGAELTTTGTYAAFPGSYTLTTGNDRTAWDDASLDLHDLGGTTWSGAMVLTDRGRDFVIDQGRSSLDRCLQATELAPENCPMLVEVESEAATEVDDESITRSIDGDPWAGELQIDYAQDAASVEVEITWEFRAQGTRGTDEVSLTGGETASYLLFVEGVSSDEPPLSWRAV